MILEEITLTTYNTTDMLQFRPKLLLLVVGLCLSLFSTAQDCEKVGVVTKVGNLGLSDCDWLILSINDGELFAPENPSLDFEEGALIKFSFEVLPDSIGCSTQLTNISITCLEYLIGNDNCQFQLEKEKTGTAYRIEIFNPTDFGPYHPQVVEWYNYETGLFLGNDPILKYAPTNNAPLLTNICVDFEVIQDDGSTCKSTLCDIIWNIPFIEASTSDTICQALFGYLPTNEIGAIQFQNLSTGFTSAIWDFGDGTIIENEEETVTYTYDELGLYEVCLTITEGSCEDTFCLPVFSIGGAEICAYNDCVFPGDANKDGRVNIFDALPIGLGYNTAGAARPNATISPNFQAAFDWLTPLIFDQDAKHADCNGDGQIDEHDFDAIDQNYQYVTKKELVINPALPPIKISFASDTIELQNAGGNAVTIPATITVGSEAQPITDFLGLAVSFDYQSNNIQAITTEAVASAFANDPSNLFLEDKNDLIDQQYGLVITKKDQKGSNGFGILAEVGFIVIVDVLEARQTNVDFSINDLKVIDSKGQIIPVNISTDSIHLTILSIESRPISTSTKEETLKQSISITPNPTAGSLLLSLDKSISYQNGIVDLYNTLGEKVLTHTITQANTRLEVSNMNAGVYWMTIRLEEGQISQQVIILD